MFSAINKVIDPTQNKISLSKELWMQSSLGIAEPIASRGIYIKEIYMLLAAGTNLEVYAIRKKDSTVRNMSFAPHRIDKSL